MVGKGVGPNSSRIFQQCYVKCCKIQNLTPLNNVIPSNNGKVVDFCVDRIKYADWPPILNALCCDLSLHSISIRCRQQVKTVLEHIDCERLAKSVNKRAVILTNFMMSNLVEAVSQLLSNTTLLSTLLLEGLPLKIPYLNPLCEAVLANSSLQHLYLPRCLIGDAGCLAICKAVRCLPNILTLDLSGCELTLAGAGYISELVKYQKIHRYSENWVHTLRYRLPDLDTMAGLRRITLCGNPQLGDAGVGRLLDVLADDLWIKGLDVQNCGLTDHGASMALQVLRSNTTMVVLDLRHNAEVSNESLSEIRAALRNNERRLGGQQGQYSWLSSISGSTSESKLIKTVSRHDKPKSRVPSNTRNASGGYVKASVNKNEKDYTEDLEEQLQEEISHRQKLEELNLQLVDQMKQMKQQQQRMWANGANSSGSEQSLQASSRSYDMSSSSGSTSSVPIDQNTLAYIQQAFKDIYTFIKNNQCKGQCLDISNHEKETEKNMETNKRSAIEENEVKDFRMNIIPKKAQSAHLKLIENVKTNKTTKSAHLLNGTLRDNGEPKLEILERNIGDTIGVHDNEKNIEDVTSKDKENSIGERSSPCGSIVSDSSETLVCTPTHTQRSRNAITINPLDAFYSSDEDSS